MRDMYTDSRYRKIAWRYYERCGAGRRLLHWEDFLAEAILRFVEGVADGTEVRSPRAFFYGICRNYCRELTRALREPEYVAPEGVPLAEIRAELDPIPPPRFSPGERLRHALGRGTWPALFTVLILGGGAAWYYSQLTCPTATLVESYLFPPALVHAQAGAVDQRNLAYRASAYYAENAHEELAKLTTESRAVAPLYYLAHDYLRRADYSRAESTFQRLLDQREELAAFAEFQDMDRLRFNLLLSRFGMSHDPRGTASALQSLLEEEGLAAGQTGERVRELLTELTGFWRWRGCS